MKGIALALALLLSGCALLERGPGEETLVLSNADAQPVSVILRIETEAGLPVFSDEVPLEARQSREFDVSMPPGRHLVYVTTTNGLSELLSIQIPDKGDSRIELTVRRGTATISVTS